MAPRALKFERFSMYMKKEDHFVRADVVGLSWMREDDVWVTTNGERLE